MKVLVTGAAGFIGHHLSKLLLKEGYQVIGIDNINDYYDPNLKLARLKDMNINIDQIAYNVPVEGDITFIKLDLTDKDEIRNLFETYRFLISSLSVRSSFTKVMSPSNGTLY